MFLGSNDFDFANLALGGISTFSPSDILSWILTIPLLLGFSSFNQVLVPGNSQIPTSTPKSKPKCFILLGLGGSPLCSLSRPAGLGRGAVSYRNNLLFVTQPLKEVTKTKVCFCLRWPQASSSFPEIRELQQLLLSSALVRRVTWNNLDQPCHFGYGTGSLDSRQISKFKTITKVYLRN